MNVRCVQAHNVRTLGVPDEVDSLGIGAPDHADDLVSVVGRSSEFAA